MVIVTNKCAFQYCRQLTEVELCEGLEQISEETIRGCNSLQCIKIPSTVRLIGKKAFQYCEQLTKMELRIGLEQVGRRQIIWKLFLAKYRDFNQTIKH